MLEQQLITFDEFKKRIVQLCLTARTVELPRRVRDRHILLKALSLRFDVDRFYTEVEVNRVIESWLSEVGHSLEIDHVTFRRTLIDERYLRRDSNGLSYQRTRFKDMQFTFDADIDTIDVKDVVRQAAEEIARRRERFRKV
jgi:hypothetical protein